MLTRNRILHAIVIAGIVLLAIATGVFTYSDTKQVGQAIQASATVLIAGGAVASVGIGIGALQSAVRSSEATASNAKSAAEQARASSAQAELMTQEFESRFRPWIAFEDPASDAAAGRLIPVFSVVLTNTGAAPARVYEITGQLSNKPSAVDPPDNSFYLVSGYQRGIIPPGRNVEVTFTMPDPEWERLADKNGDVPWKFAEVSLVACYKDYDDSREFITEIVLATPSVGREWTVISGDMS